MSFFVHAGIPYKFFFCFHTVLLVKVWVAAAVANDDIITATRTIWNVHIFLCSASTNFVTLMGPDTLPLTSELAPLFYS